MDPARAGTDTGIHDEAILSGDAVSFIGEFWEFIRERKKFWLLPIIILMLLFGGLIFLTKGTALAPFIYAIF